jgi:sugar/nucleoside kinase (ribokinase family)
MREGERILCVGAAHWDLIGRSYTKLCIGDDTPGRIERRPGGVALNIAKGLAARDHPVSLCALVGDDEAGTTLVRVMTRLGADCSHVIQIAGAVTGLYMAIEDSHGDLFAAIADANLIEQKADRLATEAITALPNFDAVMLDANIPKQALHDIATAAADAGVEIIANPVSAIKATRQAFLISSAFAPTIVANLSEANALLSAEQNNAEDAAGELRDRSSGTALVTAGPHPAALATPEATFTASPQRIADAVSVTGAGDALMAAYLATPDRKTNPRAALDHALSAAANHMRVETRA